MCYATIQAAVDQAIGGETINVADGTYNEALNITKSLTIIGNIADPSAVVINTGGLTGFGSPLAGIYINQPNVTLKGFTVNGGGQATGTQPRYGISFSGTTGGTVQNVVTQNFSRTGLNITSADTMLFDHVTAKDNGGSGIGTQDLKDTTISNITTSNNLWGGLRIETKNRLVSGIVINGTNSFGENGTGPLYLHPMHLEPILAYPITYGYSGTPDVLIQSADFAYILSGTDDEPSTYKRVHFYKTYDDAMTAAQAPNGTTAFHILEAGRYVKEIATGHFNVKNPLKIQAAIDAAITDDVIDVAVGEYTEQVIIDKDLTLQGAGRDSTKILSPASLTATGTGGAGKKGILAVISPDSASPITVDISGITVDGHAVAIDKMVGVHFFAANGSLSNSRVTGMKDLTLGSQERWGVFTNHTWDTLVSTHVTISGNIIDNYQKAGIVATELGSTMTATGNTVTGSGPTTVIAQNGIESNYGASAIISGNTVSGHNYTPGSDYGAGILVVGNHLADNPAQPSTSISDNTVFDNEVGVAISTDKSLGYGDALATINNNSITSNTTGVQNDNLSDTLDATENYWGSSSPNFGTIISGSVTFRPYYTDSLKSILSPTVPGTPTTSLTSSTNNTTPTWNWASSIDADHYIFYWSTVLGETTFNSGNISGTSYIHANPLTDAIWYTKVKAYDLGNNPSAFSGNSSPLTVDTTAPTGTIVINSGATYTNSHNVTLTLGAGSDLSGVTEMAFSNGSVYSGWEAYSTLKSLWTLSPNDGLKTVRVKFRDAAGNETAIGIPATITIDTTKPVITSRDNITVEATSNTGATVTYTSPTTSDAVDGASTAVCTPASGTVFALGTTIVTCTKTDAAGNTATPTTFNITVQDTTSPVITRNGDASITLEIKTPYTDADATATDLVGGNLTSSIVIVNPVNVNTAGTYTITYNVKDAANNSATQVTRTVIIQDSIEEAFNKISSDLSGSPNYVANNLNDVTTDNVEDFPGLYFEKRTDIANASTALGRITFNSELDLRDTETKSFLENLGAKLDTSVSSGSAILGLDFTGATISNALKNVSATIKFYNLNNLGFDANSTSSEINTKLIALDDNGNVIDKSSLITSPGVFTPPVGACEVGGYCYIFELPVNHFTKYKVDNTAPTVTKLGNNSVDVALSTGTTNLVFSEKLSDSSKTAVQNALTAGADHTITYSWSEGTLTITASQTITFDNDVVVNISDVAGNTTNSALLIDSELASGQISPSTGEDGSGTATADTETPEVVITDPYQPVDITITDGTDNPTIDVSAFVTNGEGDIPQININSATADIEIPATTVTGPEDWNGIIAAPTVTTIDLPVVSGETSTLGTAIEIGFATDKLSFDNAVRILLPNQAGKKAGYSRPETDFIEITTLCGEDTRMWADTNLGVDGECKIDVGLDLVIWTKHFTKFASYTQTTNSSSGSVGTTTASAPVCNDTKPGSAPSGLTAVAGFNSVTLTWNKASDPVSYYLITYGTSSGSQTYGNPNIGGASTTSYTITNLSGGIKYYFKVRAGNGCAPGDYSNEASTTPSGGFVEGVAPGFEAGVLGESTEQDIETTPTETTKPTSSPEVKGIDTKDWNARNIALISFGSALAILALLLLWRKNKK